MLFFKHAHKLNLESFVHESLKHDY